MASKITETAQHIRPGKTDRKKLASKARASSCRSLGSAKEKCYRTLWEMHHVGNVECA